MKTCGCYPNVTIANCNIFYALTYNVKMKHILIQIVTIHIIYVTYILYIYIKS